MQYQSLNKDAFFWALQGICALHRRPFSIELADQQFAAPYTLDSFLRATQNYALEATLRKTRSEKLHKESFPLVAWLKTISTSEDGTQVDNAGNCGDNQSPVSEKSEAPQTTPALILQADAANILVIEPGEGSPRTISLVEFSRRYLEHITRITPKADLAADPDIEAEVRQTRKFGFSCISNDLAFQQMQARRLEAELTDQPMLPKAGDDPERYAQVQSQYTAHRKAFLDSLDQEKSLLTKAEHEKRSASEILNKLQQTLPSYKKSADAYAKLEKEGFIAGIAATEKQREAIEKSKDLDAQQSTVAALNATISAQQKRIDQLQSAYKSELQKEWAEVRARIDQLQPNLSKSLYREGLMELKAPQDGVIKDLATTTVGAVVQPGTVVLTLVPTGEQLFADVNIKNDDVGFVQLGQSAQVKLAAFPFQKYGMLTGKVVRVSADASEHRGANSSSTAADENNDAGAFATYKARIKLDQQSLSSPQGVALSIALGMQVVAEINQGKRTVLEYLLSPVQKATQEAARER